MVLNDNKITIANGKVLKNQSAGFSLVSVKRFFPFGRNWNSADNYGRVEFRFSEPTNVTVDWGDGTIEVFSTVPVGEYHRFRVERQRNRGTNETSSSDPINPAESFGRHYSNTSIRLVRFFYKEDLLIYIGLLENTLIEQDFTLNFSNHPNLETLNLHRNVIDKDADLVEGGSFKNFNFRNFTSDNVSYVTIVGSMSVNYNYISEIPLEFFSMPLRVLGIGGKHNSKTFSASRLNMIGEVLSDTLEEINLLIPFNNNQGISESPADPAYPNEGILPGNFEKLVNLKNLSLDSIGNTNWVKFPEVISKIPSLEYLNFRNTLTGNNFSDRADFFNNLINLRTIDVTRFQERFHLDYYETFFTNLPVNVEIIRSQALNNVTRQNLQVMAMYRWVKNNDLFDKIFAIQNLGNANAATPSGTYQEPEDLDNPASPLEAIWVMRNIYNCTITYVE